MVDGFLILLKFILAIIIKNYLMKKNYKYFTINFTSILKLKYIRDVKFMIIMILFPIDNYLPIIVDKNSKTFNPK